MMIHFGLENNIIVTGVVVEVGGFLAQSEMSTAADEWMEHGERMANSPSAISAAASRKCRFVCLSAVATLVRAKNDLLLPLRSLRLPQGYQVTHANSNL